MSEILSTSDIKFAAMRHLNTSSTVDDHELEQAEEYYKVHGKLSGDHVHIRRIVHCKKTIDFDKIGKDKLDTFLTDSIGGHALLYDDYKVSYHSDNDGHSVIELEIDIDESELKLRIEKDKEKRIDKNIRNGILGILAAVVVFSLLFDINIIYGIFAFGVIMGFLFLIADIFAYLR